MKRDAMSEVWGSNNVDEVGGATLQLECERGDDGIFRWYVNGEYDEWHDTGVHGKSLKEAASAATAKWGAAFAPAIQGWIDEAEKCVKRNRIVNAVNDLIPDDEDILGEVILSLKVRSGEVKKESLPSDVQSVQQKTAAA